MTAAFVAAADAAVFAAIASTAARGRPPHPSAAALAAAITAATAAATTLWAPDFPLPRTPAVDLEAVAAFAAGSPMLHILSKVSAVVAVSRAVISLITDGVYVPLTPLSALPEVVARVVENDADGAAAACRVVPPWLAVPFLTGLRGE